MKVFARHKTPVRKWTDVGSGVHRAKSYYIPAIFYLLSAGIFGAARLVVLLRITFTHQVRHRGAGIGPSERHSGVFGAARLVVLLRITFTHQVRHRGAGIGPSERHSCRDAHRLPIVSFGLAR